MYLMKEFAIFLEKLLNTGIKEAVIGLCVLRKMEAVILQIHIRLEIH